MPKFHITFPNNLQSLHHQEEQLRGKALGIVWKSTHLQLHLALVEAAMGLADELRQFSSTDEDLKVIQILGMRTFNAFGASLKLALSGYHQISALILRDVLETAFLLDLFESDRCQIEIWRAADEKARRREFSPVEVRKKLDHRDGYTSKKRYEMYSMFSELAGHPNMKSLLMMRPQKGGDAVLGPFMEETTLEAVTSEMGRLAVQIGEKLIAFFPADGSGSLSIQHPFDDLKNEWIAEFYRATGKQ